MSNTNPSPIVEVVVTGQDVPLTGAIVNILGEEVLTAVAEAKAHIIIAIDKDIERGHYDADALPQLLGLTNANA